MHIIRRSSIDEKWQQTKQRVFKRDSCCRLCKILTPIECVLLKKNAGSMLTNLDPAHWLPASQYPEYCYCSWNICALNHYSHNMLDMYKSPIDGTPITSEQHKQWWSRILKGDSVQYNYIKSLNISEGV